MSLQWIEGAVTGINTRRIIKLILGTVTVINTRRMIKLILGLKLVCLNFLKEPFSLSGGSIMFQEEETSIFAYCWGSLGDNWALMVFTRVFNHRARNVW